MQNTKLKVDWNNCKAAMTHFNNEVLKALKAGKVLEVGFKEYENDRSAAQNRLLWKWHNESCAHIKAHWGVVCSPQALHEEITERLGYFTTERGVKGMVNVRERTSKMSTKRFTQFLNDYEQYAVETWDLRFSHPDDLYYMAMGR